MKPLQYDAFKKGVNIIKSCTTADHCLLAKKYINLFAKNYSKNHDWLYLTHLLSVKIHMLHVGY